MKKSNTAKKVFLTTAAASIVTPAVSAYATEITIQPGDTLSNLAKKYNTTVSDLKKLNSLTSDMIYAGEILKVPGQETNDAGQKKVVNDTRASYKVEAGDSLWKIAKNAQISVDALKATNQLDSDLIYVGQLLTIPSSNQVVSSPVSKTTIVSNTLVKQGTYVIQPGDTLSKISRETGTSISNLKAYNQLSSDLIHAGKTLNLTGSTEAPKEVAQATETPSVKINVQNNQKINGTSYTVQPGDSLWKIARNSGVSVGQLKQLNGLTSDAIYVGMTLSLQGKASESNVQTTTPKTTPVATEAPKQQKTSQTITGDTYVVQPGDSLWKIAQKTGLTVNQLKQYNQLNSDRLNVGTKLSLQKTGQVVQNQTSSSPAPQPVQVTNQSTYKVQAGDTLSGIGQKFNMSVDTLKALNPEVSNGIVYIGQTIKVAGTPKQVAAPQGTGNIISTAKQFMGVPYVFGGTTPGGFDCSGFTQYVFKQNGKSIPRTAAAQYNAGQSVSQPQVGDMVFFEGTYKSGVSHNGIYLGNGQFIHADSTKGVTISSLSNSYWKAHYAGAKRF
ncbi:C40 family peptidase [Massilibacterium senegalense]|uniref:C40 family peptidase n=1 Tax=Massilibacterium senegalense TaxID=1632858 RepID=UPI000783F1EB|nr:peptidoglycan endopeptidase [Massilibacterium senegalense]